ncbi:hypothetical protein HMPREF0973_01742 [Prevotella veroralis F0319]|uniref:Uncharacterized protein n=1 Tax=Prevotella veroralis F0319 TaxID=649761 RepID=C9MQ43_9BACT|nr:hypothetical protein HMPREF0973_01742 [Prevotella veroralis F0319]
MNDDLSLESCAFDERKRYKGTKPEMLFITLLEVASNLYP